MAVLRSNLTRIAMQAPEAASRALLQTGADIASIAKQLAPVDTGALRDSIGAVPVSSNEVHIGTDKKYGPWVEGGTTRMSSQPFLAPAMQEAESTFKARLAEEINKIIN